MSTDETKIVNFPIGRKNEETPESMAPVKEVVEAVEYLLEQAKQGRIRAIAYAFGKPSYAASYGWIGVGRDVVMNHVVHSGVGILHTAMAVELDEEATTLPEKDEGGDEPT